jgi:hypothetical protein
MTRYTKLGRKQHVDSGSWESAPLTPAKAKQPRSRGDGEQEGSGAEQNSGSKKRSFSKLDGKGKLPLFIYKIQSYLNSLHLGQGDQRMSANEKRQKRRAVQKTTNTVCSVILFPSENIFLLTHFMTRYVLHADREDTTAKIVQIQRSKAPEYATTVDQPSTP